MSDLLGQSHHLEADEEHLETPRELVIETPRPKNIIHTGHVNLKAVGLKNAPPVVVIIGKKP